MKTNKEAIMQYLDDIYRKGEGIPGIRSLREKFGTGSYSTLGGIIKEWQESKDKREKEELDETSLHSADLEGKMVSAILPVLKDRLKEILSTVYERSQAEVIAARRLRDEAIAELDEVNRENQRLKIELEKASMERAAMNKTMADKIEAMAMKCAEEKQALRDKYELQLNQRSDLERKLDALIAQSQPRPKGRPKKYQSVPVLKTEETESMPE